MSFAYPTELNFKRCLEICKCTIANSVRRVSAGFTSFISKMELLMKCESYITLT